MNPVRFTSRNYFGRRVGYHSVRPALRSAGFSYCSPGRKANDLRWVDRQWMAYRQLDDALICRSLSIRYCQPRVAGGGRTALEKTRASGRYTFAAGDRHGNKAFTFQAGSRGPDFIYRSHKSEAKCCDEYEGCQYVAVPAGVLIHSRTGLISAKLVYKHPQFIFMPYGVELKGEH